MKRSLIVLTCVLTGLISAYAQADVWSGELAVQGMRLPIVFHLDEENPVMDSPTQGAKGIPIQVARLSADSISISIPMIGATFEGECAADSITGTFTQRGLSLPLTLRQEEKILPRPQTPAPPYPYLQEEVSFSNGDATLRGTLTLPEGYDRETPVVIMITGSGLQNRDEELFEHKPFAVIADALARDGIATLRYDDRGFGESTGDAVNCTTEDLTNDALAGIRLLRERFTHVGALGHSEGGTIALMLAAGKHTDFIVSLAGMVVSGRELLMAQNRYALTQAGYPKEVVDEYCTLLQAAFDGDDSLLAKSQSSPLPAELKQNLQGVARQLATPYMRYFLSLDMRDRLADVNCPVLALNGTKDTQVDYVANLEALRKGLPDNALNDVVALEGLNHMMQHCSTGSTSEYGTIEETISPEALDIISRWIRRQGLD